MQIRHVGMWQISGATSLTAKSLQKQQRNLPLLDLIVSPLAAA